MTYSLRVPRKLVLRSVSILLAALLILLCRAAYRPIRGIRVHVVLSGSMQPTLQVGSILITRSETLARYYPGDIILFQASYPQATLIAHRLVRWTQSSTGATVAETKGDANSNGDPWQIRPNQILGKKVIVVPWLGYGFHAVTTHSGFVLVSTIIFFTVVLAEVRYLILCITRSVSKKTGEA